MKLLISAVLAYVASGGMQIRNDLRLPTAERPGWAVRPTLETAVLAGVTWFVRPYVDARRVIGPGHRALFAGFVGAGVRMAIFTAFIWACVAVAGRLFEGTAVMVSISALFILVGVPAVSVPIDLLLASLISALRGR